MWISRQIIKEEKLPPTECGKVTMNSGGKIEAASTGVERNVDFIRLTDIFPACLKVKNYCLPKAAESKFASVLKVIARQWATGK